MKNYYGAPRVSTYFNRSGSAAIDLRAEMDKILRGDGVVPAQGHWILYRRFDLTRHSVYWSEEYREAMGGPAWEYSEELLLTRHTSMTRGMMPFFEMHIAPGVLGVGYRVYYLEYNVMPKKEDVIYELDVDDHSVKPAMVGLEAVQMFNILETVPYRGDNGRIEYWACLSREESILS